MYMCEVSKTFQQIQKTNRQMNIGCNEKAEKKNKMDSEENGGYKL